MGYLNYVSYEFEGNVKSEKMKNGSILPMWFGCVKNEKFENLRFW